MNTRGPHDPSWDELSHDDMVAARKAREPLVSFSIVALRDGSLRSDVQTHDNSYADVSQGLAAVKREIERVFKEQKTCPHYPNNPTEAKTPIRRSEPTGEQS